MNRPELSQIFKQSQDEMLPHQKLKPPLKNSSGLTRCEQEVLVLIRRIEEQQEVLKMQGKQIKRLRKRVQSLELGPLGEQPRHISTVTETIESELERVVTPGKKTEEEITSEIS